MKKNIILMVMFALISSAAIASEYQLIIPQNDKIYQDLYFMANSGLIKSVSPDHFKFGAITKYEAAMYIVEAAANVTAQAEEVAAPEEGMDSGKIYAYVDMLKKYVTKFYSELTGMHKDVDKLEAALKSPELTSYKQTINDLSDEINDIEQEYKKTTFHGMPPFQIQGMLQSRWQDISSNGPNYNYSPYGIADKHNNGASLGDINHGSLGGTMMSLWTGGLISNDVNFKLNINFIKPGDEEEKGTSKPFALPEFWGTGARFLDTYTINLNVYKWQLTTGFFWEDLTPFVMKQILTERPVPFDRDVYATTEESTRGHYENIFEHSFQKRGDIWSKHGFYGLDIVNLNLFGNDQFKIMGGKAEKFDERWDKHYLYEFAGRFTHFQDFPFLSNTALSLNAFNTSNELGEVQTMAPGPGDINVGNTGVYNGLPIYAPSSFPATPYGYIQSATIMGGDLKTSITDILDIKGEFERSNFNGRLPIPEPGNSYAVFPNGDPPAFTQVGDAMYASIAPSFLPRQVKITIKYTRIDPDYVATAAAVIDTNYRTYTTPTFAPKISSITYAADPTLLYNNMNKVDVFANISVPNGFLLLNYGSSAQIRETGNMFYGEHFLMGNRLNGGIYWHEFYSNYGAAAIPPGYNDTYYGYDEYNGNRYGIDSSGAGANVNSVIAGGRGGLVTDAWLTNREYMVTKLVDPDSLTRKYYNNASAELRYAVNKLVGIPNDLFFELYGELTTLYNGADLMVDYDPNNIFCQSIVQSFLVYNITKKINLMVFGGLERWTSNNVERWDLAQATPALSWNGPYYGLDYADQAYGVGIDYDFAPRTSVFLRVKNFAHFDREVPANDFSGLQLYLELKNFF